MEISLLRKMLLEREIVIKTKKEQLIWSRLTMALKMIFPRCHTSKTSTMSIFLRCPPIAKPAHSIQSASSTKVADLDKSTMITLAMVMSRLISLAQSAKLICKFGIRTRVRIATHTTRTSVAHRRASGRIKT